MAPRIATIRSNSSVVNLSVFIFRIDTCYRAYIVTDKDARIGPHYRVVATFNHWLKIYDGDGLAHSVRANNITVYRAGELGCIIQMYDQSNK